MQISFADEVFSSSPDFRILHAIHTAIDQHHEIIIDFTGEKYVDWVSRCEATLDPDISTLLSYAIGTSIFVGSRRFVEVVNVPATGSQVTLDELTNVLLTRFYLQNCGVIFSIRLKLAR
jgi:hypothetical protein